MIDVIFYKTPIGLLESISVKPQNLRRVCSQKKLNEAYAYKCLQDLVKLGLVRKERTDDRSFDLHLTDKGRVILEMLTNIKKGLQHEA